MGKQAEIEVYTPSEYYNDLFEKCIKESGYISPKFYYLITDNKLLQEHIDQAVIDEFLLDDRNIKWYIEEVFWGMPNTSKDYIDVDNDNIIYDTISKMYDIEFVYGGSKTLCFATRK